MWKYPEQSTEDVEPGDKVIVEVSSGKIKPLSVGEVEQSTTLIFS